MHIVCFLHSHADSGDFLGIHGYSDIFEFEGCALELIGPDFNEAIWECISDEVWNTVKDSVFKIEITVENNELYPQRIERLQVIFPV